MGLTPGLLEVEHPQPYTFPKKYPKHSVMVIHHEESDEKFFTKQPIGEDSNDDGSNDEDPSRVYKEIEPNDNIRTCWLEQAHNTKVKQCLAHNM